MMMEYDFHWGSILGYEGSEEFAEVILAYARGVTTVYN